MSIIISEFLNKVNVNDMNIINTNKSTLSMQLYNIVSSRVKEMLFLIKEKLMNMNLNQFLVV